jgi:hypothetical protein
MVVFKDAVRTEQETFFISVIKTNQFMLNGAEIAACSEINTQHINTAWAERTARPC